MKRHIRHILVCLFCLSPLFSFAQTLTQYEYWFDGKVNDKVTVSLGGSEQTLDLDIPTKDLDYGMHQLFFRARQSDGQYSSVSRSTFFKLQQGNYDRLEYWLDGDRTNIKKLVGTTTADGIMMAGDFDLTGATEGAHRLYYRATNADGTVFSAISMKPVMVKSRYADNGTEGKVTKYSMWVDNDVHKMYDVLVPGNQVTLNNTVDLGHLAEGDHVLSLQFGNDTEQWSEVSQSKFTHKAVGVPTVTLKATAGNDGTVRITYNSVPNDLKSRVTRIDKNGSSTVIRNAQSGSYPHDTFFTDNPAAGTYTYQAAIIRELPNGETEVVKSNIVSVTVGQEAKNVQINSIVGLLFIGNKAANLVTGGQNLNVKFSDGKVVNTGAGCTAWYQDVEIGKTYTVSVEDNPYFTFEPKTVTVKEGMNLVSLQGKQKVSEENTAVQNDYSVYDLIINSEIKQTNNFVTMTVKNPSYGKTWKGKASLYTYDYNPSSDANQNLAASGTINTMYLNYICSSAEFTLGPSESKQIAFDLNKIDAVNFIKAKYDQYLYFFSNESANPKNKLMGCNENFSVSNPLKEKLQYKGESKKFYEAEIVQVFRDYLKTLKKLKSFNSKLEYLDGMEEVLDNMVGYDPSAYQSKYRVVKTLFGNVVLRQFSGKLVSFLRSPHR